MKNFILFCIIFGLLFLFFSSLSAQKIPSENEFCAQIDSNCAQIPREWENISAILEKVKNFSKQVEISLPKGDEVMEEVDEILEDSISFSINLLKSNHREN